ncbi:MAG: DMT family transporter [Chloroflexota bacterium]|nr:MAG: DMT family transporter [Chloroflexota bacterium]
MTPRSDRGGIVFVTIGVGLFSTSAVLVRLAVPHSAFEITFGRMVVAAAFVAVIAVATGVRLDFRAGEIGRFALYGLITAAHFLLYIWSLDYTTIAHSLALVYTAPIFVTIFAAVLLRESFPLRALSGIPIVLIGIAILTGLEARLDPRMLVGDAMAIGSAVCLGLYSVAGRRERTRQPLLRYATGVYGAAALWLIPTAALSLTGWHGLGPALSIVAMGIFPLGIGHTLYNASLRRVHPTLVNLVATQEVTGGVILGALILGEMPSPSSAIGAVLTIAGVALVLLTAPRRTEGESRTERGRTP